MRGLEACVDTAADPDLPNIEPKGVWQPRARPVFKPAVDIVKSTKPSWTLSKFVRPCGMFEVPHDLRALLHGSPEPSQVEVYRAVRALAGMAEPVLKIDAQDTRRGATGDRGTAGTLAGHAQKVSCTFLSIIFRNMHIFPSMMSLLQVCDIES